MKYNVSYKHENGGSIYIAQYWSLLLRLKQEQSFPSLGSYNSRGALGALMACLRTARAHGHLQSATDAWRNLVSSAKIKQGLIHQHCQVSKQNN